MKVVGKKKLTANKWQHLFITYDGSGRAAGTRVFLNGEKLEHTVEADGLTATIATDKPLRLGRRFNTSITNGVEIDDARFYDRELTAVEVQSLFGSDTITPLLAIAAGDRTPAQTKTLFDHYLHSLDKPYQALGKEKDKVNGEIAALSKNKITSMIMADNPANKTRKTYLLMRGQYASPDKSKEYLARHARLPSSDEGRSPENQTRHGQVVDRPRTSLDGKSRRQPSLANHLRPGAYQHPERLRIARKLAHPPRLDQLVGRRFQGQRMERQESDQANGYLSHLPPILRHPQGTH